MMSNMQATPNATVNGQYYYTQGNNAMPQQYYAAYNTAPNSMAQQSNFAPTTQYSAMPTATSPQVLYSTQGANSWLPQTTAATQEADMLTALLLGSTNNDIIRDASAMMPLSSSSSATNSISDLIAEAIVPIVAAMIMPTGGTGSNDMNGSIEDLIISMLLIAGLTGLLEGEIAQESEETIFGNNVFDSNTVSEEDLLAALMMMMMDPDAVGEVPSVNEPTLSDLLFGGLTIEDQAKMDMLGMAAGIIPLDGSVTDDATIDNMSDGDLTMLYMLGESAGIIAPDGTSNPGERMSEEDFTELLMVVGVQSGTFDIAPIGNGLSDDQMRLLTTVGTLSGSIYSYGGSSI